jgi:uncharacterized protein with beta-barrel porin domain
LVTAATSANFAGAVNADLITVDGTATFGEDANDADTTLVIPAGATIVVGEAVAATQTLFTATALTMNGGAGTVGLQVPSNFTSGTIILINDDNATSIAAEITDFAALDTALVDFTVQGTTGDASQIEVTAAKNSIASIAGTLGVSQSAAQSLDLGVAAAGADAAVSLAYTTALNAGGAEAKKAAEQSEPVQAAAVSSAIGGGATAVTNIVSGRLASVRGESNTAYASRSHTGFAAGDGAAGQSVWFRPFISSSEQDDSTDDQGGAIDGYDGSTFGFAAGFDGLVGEQTRVGLSIAFADTDINGDGVQNDKTNLDNYQLTVYGDHTTDSMYLEGMLSYGVSDVTTTRDINFGGLGLQARGAYDAHQYTARAGVGVPITNGNTTFTPNESFQYTNVSSDTFTETGAGVLNLAIDPEDLDLAVGTVGVNWQTSYQSGGGTWTPQIRTAVYYDFAGDEADSVSRFTGQNTTFTTKGAEVEELGANIGAGLSLSAADGAWDISADYDADIKDNYLAHTGRFLAKINF